MPAQALLTKCGLLIGRLREFPSPSSPPGAVPHPPPRPGGGTPPAPPPPPPCWCPRGWPTPSWRACRRSPGSTPPSSACSPTPFGPSPRLVLGPDSSLGPMIAAAVLPLAAGSPERAIALAGMLALMVGLICVAAGVARLGFVADLLSKPVRVGYLAGLAVTIVVGQLPKLLGISIDADGFLQEVGAIVANLGQTNPWTLAIGLVLTLDHPPEAPAGPGRACWSPWWRPSAVTVLGPGGAGRGDVGVLPQGFPRRASPALSCRTFRLLAATPWASRWWPSATPSRPRPASPPGAPRGRRQPGAGRHRRGQRAGRLLPGLPGQHQRLAHGGGRAVGRQDPTDRVVAAGAVLAMLLFVPGLVQNLPQAALAAIVIAAGISLFDVAELRRLLADAPQSSSGWRWLCGPGGDPRGGAAGHRDRGAPVDRAGLPPRLAALLGGAGRAGGRRRLPRPHPLSGRARIAGPADPPLGRAAVLRQRQHLPQDRPRAGRRSEPPPLWVASPPSRSRISTPPPPTCWRTWTRS